MNTNDNPFRFLEDFDVAKVAQILTGELPFVAGAALSRMSPIFNAKVMANMQEAMRNEVAVAISKYRSIPTEVMYDIAEELEKKLKKPETNQFTKQKNSILSNLDLGAISNAISNLKTDKNKPVNQSNSSLEPVESRIIKPEEYDEYLRGGLEPDPILEPEYFEPTVHKSLEKSPSQPKPLQSNNQANELDSKTKKELALQQALLHTRSKKHDTRVMSRPAKPVPQQKSTSYKPQKIDGMALAAHILRESSPELRQRVCNEVPDLYRKLNDRMFDFADLEHSSRETIGKIFTGIDPRTSALALRFSSEHLKNTALTSVSKRKSIMIIEEFKKSSKEKVRITAIEDAQQEIIDYAIELQTRGEIIIDPNDSSIV